MLEPNMEIAGVRSLKSRIESNRNSASRESNRARRTMTKRIINKIARRLPHRCTCSIGKLLRRKSSKGLDIIYVYDSVRRNWRVARRNNTIQVVHPIKRHIRVVGTGSACDLCVRHIRRHARYPARQYLSDYAWISIKQPWKPKEGLIRQIGTPQCRNITGNPD